MFNNEILKSNAPFGNAVRGFGGGLIDQHAWETNHGYVYVSLDRWESKSADNVPKTIGIKFTNASNITCDYHCFLIYEDEINLNSSTGQLILQYIERSRKLYSVTIIYKNVRAYNRFVFNKCTVLKNG